MCRCANNNTRRHEKGNTMEIKELQLLACDLRLNIIDIVCAGKGGHIGGDMSVLGILMELYLHQMKIDPKDAKNKDRDRFILSKGHSVEAYYAVLAAKGFITLQEVLEQFNQFGTNFIGHPNNHINGIEMNTGSLGHGLSISVGMALAGKLDKSPYRVYTVMGDGELAEGSVWEAVMAANQYKLDNLCAVVDRNRLQISGDTEDVMGHDDLQQRFASFGWNVMNVVDGNDFVQLRKAFDKARELKGKPTVLIANTVKGKGSTVMENKAAWHHKVPNAEEYAQITKDILDRKRVLEG